MDTFLVNQVGPHRKESEPGATFNLKGAGGMTEQSTSGWGTGVGHVTGEQTQREMQDDSSPWERAQWPPLENPP